MKGGKKVPGYFLLGILFFYAFSLLQFPYDRLKRSWVQQFEEALPLTLSIDRAAPLLPAGLRLENIRVETGPLSFRLPDLEIRPDLPALLSGKFGLDLKDPGLSRLQGRFRSEKGKNRLDLRLNQAEIQALAGKETSFRIRLSGEGSLQWDRDSFEKGSGQFWSLLERGELKGKQPPEIPFPLTLFDTVRGEVQFGDGLARVKRLEASGKDTRFSLPQQIQIPLKGGALPPELLLLLQMIPK